MEIGNMLFGHSRGKYPLTNRDELQRAWAATLEKYFDSHAYYMGEDKNSRGGFENDIFLVNPYYWGDDEEIVKEPNFIYKPINLTAQWYKYPWRDAYANKKISYKEWLEIFRKCEESICTKFQ